MEKRLLEGDDVIVQDEDLPSDKITESEPDSDLMVPVMALHI